MLYVACGEGKQEVLLKHDIKLTAVIDEVAASANNNNLEINIIIINVVDKKRLNS